MTVNLSFLRARGSGIGGMSITAPSCGGCGAEIINASTACDLLCVECRKLDDQALVTRMAEAVMAAGRAVETISQLRVLLKRIPDGVHTTTPPDICDFYMAAWELLREPE